MEASEIWWPQWRLRHHAANAKELEHLSSSGGMAVGFAPVSSGADPLLVTGVQTQSLSVWRTLSGCGFASRPKFEADVITVRSVESGQLRRSAKEQSFVADRGDVTLTWFPTLLEETATADFTSTSITVDRHALETAYRLVQQKTCEISSFQSRISDNDRCVRPIRRAIAHIYRYVSEDVEQSDYTAIFIRDMFLLYTVAFWPLRGETGNPSEPVAAAPQGFRAALHHIEQNLAGPITLSEIAAAANVGPRALQMAFKRELGVTPLTYVIRRRLDAVRTDLASRELDQQPIRQVAERWGFTNMSDFARRFKDAFGQTPRELRKNRD